MRNANPDLVARFVVYMRTERGASDNTAQSYEIDLHKFAAWFGAPLVNAQRNDLQKYVNDLLATGLSARTAARRLSCLRHFYSFLVDEGEITKEPTRNLPVPKQWKTVPRALGRVDFEKMLGSITKGRFSGLDVRDRAILLTFYASGLRESELADLKLQDLDLNTGVAKVWAGKGDKDGIVPLNPRTVAALREYIESVRPMLVHGLTLPWVFLSRAGGRMTRQEVYYRIRNIAERAIGKRVSPHFLRHGFATALIEGGADVRDVQVLMRHSDVNTTAIYIHTDLSYLRRIYYVSHPRARVAPAQN